MNAEELIIGHFDKALSSSEEGQLQSLLSGSADARSLYERHEAIQTMMIGDAATLVPSAALDEAAIGAALGAASEISGGGAGAWFGSKVAAAISAVAIGTLSIALITSTGSNHTAVTTPKAATPAVRSLPGTPTPVVTAPAAPEVAAPAADVQTSTAQEQAAPQKTPVRLTSKMKAANDKLARKSGSAKSVPSVNLSTDQTVVNHPATIGHK
jgi:hypothetical protein